MSAELEPAAPDTTSTSENVKQPPSGMTEAAIKESCMENGGYRTPSLNDKLYLHYKGWPKIQNLDNYTGAKCIWLEANGISVIENLEPCKDTLRQLFLQQNCIQKISGLEELRQLVGINLGENLIHKIEGLEGLTQLNTLQLAQNYLETYEDLEGLIACPSLGSLELNKNKIEDPRALDIFAQLPNLKVLKLDGNPITRKLPHYRKSVICRLKNLTYLDDRPVFPDERLMAEAWGRGGLEAEKIERARQRKLREYTEKNRHVQFFKYIEEAKKARRAKNKSQSDGAGWKPVNGEAMAEQHEKQAASKPREVLPSRTRAQEEQHVQSTAKSTQQAWALPRRECVIKPLDAAAEPGARSNKASREQKRASRQARLQKAMQLVGEGSAAAAPAEVSKPKSAPKKLLIQEIDSSEETQLAASKTDLMGAEALKQAAKQHAKQGTTKWAEEMNNFENELQPDTPMVQIDATEVLDLDELD